MMYLLTEQEHAQIVEAIDNWIKEVVFNRGVAPTAAYEALATLQALPEVKVVGVTNDCEISYMQSKEEAMGGMFKVGGERAHNEDADIELYARETQ